MTARRWRRPTAFAWALTAFGVAMFCALGVWQVERAAQKRQLFAAFANAAQTSPQPLTGAVGANDPDLFPHVGGLGAFDAQHGYLLDERVHNDRLGVEAIAVFHAVGVAAPLLVDRGWVAWDHMPGTTPAVPPLPKGDVQLSGIYAPFPGSGLRLGGNALPGQSKWPKLTLFLDRDAIAADLGTSVLPRILLLDPEPGSGFVRSWKPQVFPPERHIGYAFTWFCFAAVAIAIFVVTHWIKVEK